MKKLNTSREDLQIYLIIYKIIKIKIDPRFYLKCRTKNILNGVYSTIMN